MGTEAAAVITNDWIWGVTFTILATFIGGASKLSIRKSWLIDAKRKQVIINTDGEELEYVEFVNPCKITKDTHNNSDGLIPDNHLQEWKCGGGGTDSATRSTATASDSIGNNITNTCHPLLPQQTSWLLYLSGMIGMSCLHPLCSVLALKYAAPSILAPFSGLGLVWIVLFSPRVVGETPGRNQKAACALIVAGGFLVAAFGDHTNGEERGVEDVLSSYQRPAFRTFFVLQTLHVILLGVFIRVCRQTSPLKKFAWGSIGGSVAGFQNFLKDSLTILVAVRASQGSSASGKVIPTSLPPSFFLLVALATLTGVAGLLCLAACMKRYDAVFSQGMFVVSFVVSASLMSLVHYRTLEHLAGAADYAVYPLGLALLFLGAFVLVKPQAVLSEITEGEDWAVDERDPFCSGVNTSTDVRHEGCREKLLDDDAPLIVFV